ncbi:MAG: nitrous oxide-stimulated promoter family protein [Planctomycetota bacterium]|jgi:hypothetical protein
MKKSQIEKQHRIFKRFTEVYCEKHHGTARGIPCPDCRALIDYARRRLEKCPYDPKPKCKNCPTHCYKPKYRELVKEIMRFSGMHFVRRGRIDWLIKYFLAS